MKQFSLLYLVFMCSWLCSNAQKLEGQELIDSLQAELPKIKNDTQVIKALKKISFQFTYINQDSGLYYGKKCLEISQEMGYLKGMSAAYATIAGNYTLKNNYDSAHLNYERSLAIDVQLNDEDKQCIKYYNLATLYSRQSQYSESIEFYKKCLEISKRINGKEEVAQTLTHIGNCYFKLSEFDSAKIYFKLSEKQLNSLNKATSTSSLNMSRLGGICVNEGDFNNGIQYYFKALNIAKSLNDKDNIGGQQHNIASIYIEQEEYVKAKELLHEAIANYNSINNEMGIAVCFYELAYIYHTEQLFKESIATYDKAIKIIKAVGNDYYLAIGYNGLAEVYYELKEYKKALDYCEKARDLSIKSKSDKNLASSLYRAGMIYLLYAKNETTGKKRLMLMEAVNNFKKSIEISSKLKILSTNINSLTGLHKAYYMLSQYKQAYNTLSEYMVQHDSFFNEESLKKTTRQLVQFEYQKKNLRDSIQNAEARKLAAVKLQRQRTMTFSGIGAALLLLAFSVFIFRNNKKLGIEKERSENLLHNILPEEVADELKNRGATTAQYYDHVTVLFTDFVDFTKAGERMGSQELVEELHNCFKAFDGVMDKYGIEKIKTIGDAYLAVCGLPLADNQHADKIIKAAQEISDFMMQRREKLGEKTFEIRIGIHSGDVVAGIVGVKKFAYDIWGDTVNTAARMEQNSEPGKINISQTTYELIKSKFICTYRGELEAKNKGKLKMYFVNA